MDGFVPEDKYQKLASEYAKLRAQASVLKKALIEDQAKSSALRDQLRQKDTLLRRAEQEIDSLGFRNKQLEHRVGSLQEDLAIFETQKKERKKKWINDKIDAQQVDLTSSSKHENYQNSLTFEELQKKVMENAELTSLIDDKERCLQMHTDHIKNMEKIIAKLNLDHADVEKRLRKEIEALQIRNQDLETKLVDASSMLGSEDALSASGSDYTPYHSNQQQQSTHPTIISDFRITSLEKDVAHWRSQYEMKKAYVETLVGTSKNESDIPSNFGSFNCSCTTTAAGISTDPLPTGVKSLKDSGTESTITATKELLLYDSLGKKFENLLREKLLAESRITSMLTENDNLQNCLENATHELKYKDEQLESINRALRLLEEDLTTTRVNYDEQISVLTEQIISLSEQLAASK